MKSSSRLFLKHVMDILNERRCTSFTEYKTNNASICSKVFLLFALCISILSCPVESHASSEGGKVPVRIVGRGVPQQAVTRGAVSGSASQTNMNVVMSDMRIASAKTWLFGVLGGSREEIFNIPALLGNVPENDAYLFVWEREIAFPASSWAMGQAVINKVGSGHGDEIIIDFSFPDIEPLLSSGKGRPRSATEWDLFLSLRSGRIVPKIASAQRTVRINESGQLVFSDEAMKRAWMMIPSKEINKALSWYLEGNERPSEGVVKYLSELRREMEHSVTLRPNRETLSLLARLLK